MTTGQGRPLCEGAVSAAKGPAKVRKERVLEGHRGPEPRQEGARPRVAGLRAALGGERRDWQAGVAAPRSQ